MAVSSSVVKHVYAGNGLTTTFPFTFPVVSQSDIHVYLTDSQGIVTELESNFSIVGSNIHYPVDTVLAPVLPDGYKLTLSRISETTQTLTLQNGAGVSLPSLEQAYDKLTMIVQEQAESISRAVKFPVDTIPTSDDTDSYINALNASKASAQSSATAAANSATNSASSATASANSAAASATSATASASSASGASASASAASTSATNAASSATAASGSATSAATQATNSASSATAAASSASTASTQATSASNSATAAVSSASAASTSATNAANSATAAATSATNAANSATAAATSATNAQNAYNGATSANTANTVVKRDASGNFSAGTMTGNVTGSAGSFTGALVGDVTGTQGATVVSSVGGSSAANVHSAEIAANAATNANTASAIVKRDAAGNFSAGTITASLTGAASLNVSKAGDTMTGALNLPSNGLNVGSGQLAVINGNIAVASSLTPTGNIDIYGGGGATVNPSQGIPAFAFTMSGFNGFRHFIKTRHDGGGLTNGNSIDFYLNSSTSAGGSGAIGTGNTLCLSATAVGVGIKNAYPTAELDVTGAIKASTTVTAPTFFSTAANTFKNGDDGSAVDNRVQVKFEWQGGGYAHYMRSRHAPAGAGNAIDFFINNGTGTASSAPGNNNLLKLCIGSIGVGVGTSSPADTLDVQGRINLLESATPTSGAGNLPAAGSRKFYAKSGQLYHMGSDGVEVQLASTSFKAPTFQRLTSGTTYTTPTNPAPIYLEVEILAAGGGGSGGPGGGNGGNGGSTSFGTSTVTGGSGGIASTGSAGAGGTVSIGAGATTIISVSGQNGRGASAVTAQGPGENGGVSFFGGAGSGVLNGSGGSAAANSGSGGAGAGSNGSVSNGSSGGAGAYAKFMIPSPAASYTIALGAAGAGGTAGTAGYTGGSGGTSIIIVKECYQ